MPRYFFDVEDNGQQTRDDVGLDLADRETARREAISSLVDLARDELPDGDHRRFVIKVREAQVAGQATGGDYLLIATLAVDAEWVEGES